MNDKRKQGIKNIIYISKMGLAFCKSMINGIFQTSWGIAGIFIMYASLFYVHEKFNVDITYVSKTFMQLTGWVLHNVSLIFLLFWVVYFIYEFRDLNRKEAKA